ncbi:hypothetical protein, partial [Klebsiella aerogenes]|uniref:hypothetical protein n=1 Tax=Klebsiella aerogenes TaxID=548 RepID=UPI0021BB8A6B
AVLLIYKYESQSFKFRHSIAQSQIAGIKGRGAMFIFALTSRRGRKSILLPLSGGEFPCAEERSVQISMQFVIRTRISVNWLIHREAPGVADKYTGIP